MISPSIVAVGAHSCGHVSISFVHVNPNKVADSIDWAVANPQMFKAMMLDLVTAAVLRESSGIPDPHRFGEQL